MSKKGLFQECKGHTIIMKSLNGTYYIDKLREKSDVSKWIDAEKVSEKL